MSTQAQIDANRANALMSTGPRTAEGKDAARRNAMKHGLCAETLLLPEEEEDAIAVRVARLGECMEPADEFEAVLVEQFAACSVRLRRCRGNEAALLTRRAIRAEQCWDADRHAEAAEIGKALAKSPRETVHSLLKTRHGCDWLHFHWGRLADSLQVRGDLEGEEWELARQLQGIPESLRVRPQ